MFKKAFTMAEILLVVAIIGVVATLTIPNLANQSHDDQTVVKLKQVKNDLDLALQKALLQHGEYAMWYSSFTTANKLDAIERILEHLEISANNATFPNTTYNSNSSYYKYELKDSTRIAVRFGSEESSCSGDACNCIQFIVATGGLNGKTLGKQIFGFSMDPYNGTVHGYGYGKDFNSSNTMNATGINATNWAINKGNLEYLKCSSSLNWQTKATCD